MSEIKIAIAGVGNCACSLVQGLYYYEDSKVGEEGIPGLMHTVLGGYKVSDVVPVAAFDVDARKVGKDLSEAIFAPPNNTLKFSDVPKLDVEVMMGPVMDGISDHLRDFVKVSSQKPIEVADVLRETGAEMLVNFIPTGSSKATRFYADEAIKEAEIGFINGIPELIASSEEYSREAEKHGVPLIGDDVKSQVGATILHRSLVKLFLDRGVRIKKSYQLNYGGNLDFYNLATIRGKSKEMTKASALESLIPYKVELSPGFAFISLLNDTKIAFVSLEGIKFGGVPIKLEAKLEVVDSPNSAGVIIDAIRCCKLALDRGVGGVLISPSAYFMKHPPEQFSDEEAKRMVEGFIAGKRER